MTLKALSNAEFMALKFPNPRRLVKPIISWGSFVLLNGPGESGKTMLADTLAIAVASGGLFLDEYECKQGTVVIVQVDMPLPDYQDRWRRLDANNLPIYHAINDSPIDIFKQLKPLQDLAELKPALVIFDSLRNMHMLDEDSSESPTRVCQRCKEYFPNSTILWIHHDRRTVQGPGVTFGPSDSKHRGSGAWRDRVATQMELTRVEEKKGWFTQLRFTKAQNCPIQRTMKLTIDPTTLLLKPAMMTERQVKNKYKRSHPNASESEVAAFVEGVFVNA